VSGETSTSATRFFKIVKLRRHPRDLDAIAKMAPDIVILDEAQRIKNWKTRTAQSVKAVNSPYALVLTGTPLENRLEELYSHRAVRRPPSSGAAVPLPARPPGDGA